jgi:hypothetical protein
MFRAAAFAWFQSLFAAETAVFQARFAARNIPLILLMNHDAVRFIHPALRFFRRASASFLRCSRRP